jgi:membrane protein DedA with SNARE-associated domain
VEHIIWFFESHGVLAVFLGVFIEQLGAPIPAVPFLLLAGAQGAGKPVLLWQALLAATTASILADVLWFYAGRRFGRSVLGVLCRVSASPDSCVRKTELSFTKRGALTIVFAKFIPGASTVARPLAGALGMGMRPFLLLNLAGTLLWVASSLAAGVLLRAEVSRAVHVLEGLGDAAMLVLASGLALYVGWRVSRRLFARQPT